MLGNTFLERTSPVILLETQFKWEGYAGQSFILSLARVTRFAETIDAQT